MLPDIPPFVEKACVASLCGHIPPFVEKSCVESLCGQNPSFVRRPVGIKYKDRK